MKSLLRWTGLRSLRKGATKLGLLDVLIALLLLAALLWASWLQFPAYNRANSDAATARTEIPSGENH